MRPASLVVVVEEPFRLPAAAAAMEVVAEVTRPGDIVIALGAGDIAIMFRHVLPNAMVATLSMMPFILSGSMVQLSSLDFLGFGLPPGSPSLGEMITQGKNNLQAPWLGISAFAAIAVMLSLLVFVGEAVRDAFDPRKTFR
jgi:microcin C transport system permease protein